MAPIMQHYMARSLTFFDVPRKWESLPASMKRRTSQLFGAETAWPGSPTRQLSDFADGTDRTILVIEVADSGIYGWSHATSPTRKPSRNQCETPDWPGPPQQTPWRNSRVDGGRIGSISVGKHLSAAMAITVDSGGQRRPRCILRSLGNRPRLARRDRCARGFWCS